MSKAGRASVSNQFDLFLPYVADLALRDQREMMERPFFSLAKSKRVKPIDYRSPDGKLWVHVSANPDYGMATIWDADILIYCASVLADMARRGVNDVPRKLHLMPYDLLRAIGRPTTGRAYELLGQALDRLVATTIKTNIRADASPEPASGRGRREATFSWLDGWTQLVDEKTERSRGMTIELSNWFWEGVMMTGGVLSIDRAYFDLTGGRERWLYKVARKHAGGAGEAGFAISMPTLFEKSGAEGQYRRFKFEIAKIAEKDPLPGYSLAIEQPADKREPMLRMRRRADGGPSARAAGADTGKRTSRGKAVPPQTETAEAVTGETVEGAAPAKVAASPALPLDHVARDGGEGGGAPDTRASVAAGAIMAPSPAQRFPGETPSPERIAELSATAAMIRRSVKSLAHRASAGDLTDATLATLKAECPGWDYQALHEEFRQWLAADPARTPVSYQNAFIGFVKRWDAKHRHHLGR
ncbi:Plasmid replication initiator protein [Sphingomonas sp. OV641]|uniref:replication initiator protein A n=1 Tax=Sphingomonas sp. OV641 TaxID=1881068 RepID=UPI0008D235ED|nr:replication initiator protein A [Sphingomonas sp. OV641]SEJ87031.1 Plasmid replication initiator protein [Sphingomonas sp. OV641]